MTSLPSKQKKLFVVDNLKFNIFYRQLVPHTKILWLTTTRILSSTTTKLSTGISVVRIEAFSFYRKLPELSPKIKNIAKKNIQLPDRSRQNSFVFRYYRCTYMDIPVCHHVVFVSRNYQDTSHTCKNRHSTR